LVGEGDSYIEEVMESLESKKAARERAEDKERGKKMKIRNPFWVLKGGTMTLRNPLQRGGGVALQAAGFAC